MTKPIAQLSLDEAWLGRVLDAQGGGGRPTSSGVALSHGRMSPTHRVSLQWPTPAPALPESVIVKFAPESAGGAHLDRRFDLHAQEEEFYRRWAPSVPVPVPRCWFAGWEPAGRRCLVLEDVHGTQAFHDLDGCPVDVAAQLLASAADLHAWGIVAGATGEGWAAVHRMLVRTPRTLARAFLRRFEPRLSAVAADVLRKIMARGATLPAARGPMTFVHGDLRLDNTLMTDRGACLLDWQTAGTGPALSDVAYLLGVALCIEERRRSERELVALYRARLDDQGVGLTESEAWGAYRAYALRSLLFVVAAGASVEPDEPTACLFTAIGDRVAAQVVDLETEGA